MSDMAIAYHLRCQYTLYLYIFETLLFECDSGTQKDSWRKHFKLPGSSITMLRERERERKNSRMTNEIIILKCNKKTATTTTTDTHEEREIR